MGLNIVGFALVSATIAHDSPGHFRISERISAHQLSNPTVCGWIGVRVAPMTKAFADSLGMVEPYGAIFMRPQPGSPAARAKIEAGDVITAINGSPLSRASDFSKIISNWAPGSTVYLGTWRNGQRREVKLTLGSSKCRPEQGAGV